MTEGQAFMKFMYTTSGQKQFPKKKKIPCYKYTNHISTMVVHVNTKLKSYISTLYQFTKMPQLRNGTDGVYKC